MRDVNALDPLKIQDLLFRKLADLAGEPRFRGEIARAEREFFGASPDADPTAGSNAARFSEWYLLERESEALGDVPARVLLWPAGLRDPLLDSRVGVYMVRQVLPAELLVHDLEDGSDLEVAPIAGDDVRAGVAAGDLLVGRLYPDALDRHVASCAMAVQRRAAGAADLATAFRHDLRQLGIDRRLSQAEIEHLMFRGRAGPEVAVSETPVERLEAKLDTLFRSASLSDLSTTAVSQALREAERPGVVVDPILEKVAFDSALDIAEVQRLLLALWGAYRDPTSSSQVTRVERASGRTGSGQPVARERLGEQLARRIEEGIAQHENVEEMFAEVGELIGEDLSEPEVPLAGPALGAAGPSVSPELDDGDLPALVSEYCWETHNESSHDQAILERLVQMQREVPVPQLELERVTSQDLSRLLLQIYLEAAPAARAQDVAAAFAVLDRFYSWCAEAQQMQLEAVIRGCQRDLVEQVPRLQAA
ncbi:MAG: hypothetical protein ACYS5W_11285, partial [Planctomycetota bacterium]